MKLSVATLLLATVSFVTAAAVSARADDDQATKDYDKETQDLKNRGLCRSYKNLQYEPAYTKFTDLCEPTCAEVRKVADPKKTFSVTCDASSATTLPYFPDPRDKTLQYTLGQCKCNMPIINFIGDTFVEALPAIANVTCAVWKLAAVEAAKLLTTTNPAGLAKGGTKVLIKIAKDLKKQGKGAQDWEDYVKKNIADGNACSFNIGQMFEDAVKAPMEVIQNIA